MDDNNEVKIIIKPISDGTYAIYIVEPKGTEPMTEKMASCYTIARGMIKFGLETPDVAFDYGWSYTWDRENTEASFPRPWSMWSDIGTGSEEERKMYYILNIILS